jgi:hypothetical protein
LQVTTPAVPVGGADDPDNCRVYMVPGAADWAATAGKLQSTDTGTARYLITYASGGAADGGGTAFAGTGVASIESSGTGWKLRGSGLIYRTGTSFPTGMVTGDQFFRSDLGMEFFYNGTRWLSTTLHHMSLMPTTAFLPATGTLTLHRGPMPALSGGSDIYLVTSTTRFHVSGGTALSGSHKWVGVVRKDRLTGAGANSVTFDTITIDSGASDSWRDNEYAVNALQNDGTVYNNYSTLWTKTGTPGTLYALHDITYRIVAT